MADSFQPDSFTPDTKPADSAGKADSFVADSFVPDSEPKNPLLFSGMVKDEEIDAIASKYGVNPSELKSIAPYYGATQEPKSLSDAAIQGAKGAAGFAGEAIGLGAPQFIYKKLQSEPMRNAIDDLRALGASKKSGLEKVTEFTNQLAVPLPGLPGSKSVAGRVLGASGVGAAGGTFGSKEGEELKDAATGAVIGAGLGSGAEVFGKLIGSGHIPKGEATNKQRQFDLEKGIDDVAKKTEKSEQILSDLQALKKDSLTPDEVSTIVKEQVGEDTLARYMNPSTEEGQLLRNRLPDSNTSEPALYKKMAEDILETRARNFAEDLTGTRPKNFEEASTAINEIAARQGADATAQRYRDFVKLEQAKKFIEQEGIRALDQPGFFGRALNTMSDNQFVLRGLDEKYGTTTEEILRKLNKDFNRSTYSLTDFRNQYDNIFQQARKNKTDLDVVRNTDIYNALDTGNLARLSPEQRQTAEGFKKYFQNIREFVNGGVRNKDPQIAPLSIPEISNYVPKMLKSTPEVVSILERKMAEAIRGIEEGFGRKVSDLAQLRGDEFRIASQSEPVKDLIRAAQLFDNKPINSGADLSTRLKQMLYSREGNVALESKARAALERKGEIPDFLLEKDLYKLARRYTDNTIKHLYLRDSIDKLRYQAKALRNAGADVESQYLTNLVQDLLGVRKGTAAEATMQFKIRAQRALDNAIEKAGKDSVKGGALTAVKALPDTLEALTRQIYPNVLGYGNIRAVVQNATQAITKVAPELGTKYGYATILRGAVDTVGNFRKYLAKARSMGNVPDEFVRKGEAAIADGIQRSSLYQIPAKAIEGMGKAGMVLYQGMENFNRALTIGVAETMARDLARGSRLAQESLSKFPTVIRRQITENMQNPQVTSELLSKYLNDVTQYNYNRASLSEFGRTMGPIFSAFSKWPTATVGDVVQEIRNKGLLKGTARNAEKYLGPLLLLQAIDYAVGERPDDKDSLSDRQKKVLGSGGLSQTAPLGSIGAIAKGEIFSPPAVDAIVQTFLNPVLEGDSAKFEKGAASAFANFTPFAGLFRFLTDDVVTLISGERPEGSNPIERGLEGIRQITK